MARSKTTEGSTVPHPWSNSEFRAKVGWLAGCGATLAFALALGSFNSADWPSQAVAVHNEPPSNLLGNAGAAVSYWTYAIVGYGIWPVLALVVAALVAWPMGHRIQHLWLRAVGALLLLMAVSGLHAQWFGRVGPVAGIEAGLIPQWMVAQLGARFSGVATSLILLCGTVIGATVAADEVLVRVPGAVMRGLSFLEPLWRFDWAGLLASFRGGRPQPALAGVGATAAPARTRRKAGASAMEATLIEDAKRDEDEDEEEEDEDEDDDFDDDEDYDDEDDDEEVEDEDEDEEDEDDDEIDAAPETVPVAKPLTAEELRAKAAKLPLRLASAPTKTKLRDEDIPRTEDYSGYKFPTLDLLDEPEGNFSASIEEHVRGQAATLEAALHQYGIEGSVSGIESGPVVTLYSVELAPGTRVAALTARCVDLARSLKAPNIRIIPNMVGRTAVGVEVPNPQKEKVRLKELMSGPAANGMALPMFLGKDGAGEPMVLDLSKQPHMLIAGTTGSGKSVCMNTIIMSWLYTKRPDELKLVLVDPKMVEMAQFSDIPHLMCPVVTDMSKAAGIMDWAVRKMEERYELLKSAGVRDIHSYNKLDEDTLKSRINTATDADWARVPKRLPFMVFVVDELADLMLTHKEVETSIVRIAQKARAVGMHLVLATQRPSANVVTGLIKSNMPCRVAFRVNSAMDSRIVLDQKGAELLLGHGDMMALTNGAQVTRRAQGTLVSDDEARAVTGFLRNVAKPSFERVLVAIKGPASAEGADGEGGAAGGISAAERDPLFDKAVEIIIESGRGSVSHLQRRMAIGYGRASRLVDQMGEAGILGPHKGNGIQRDVLITLEDWRRMQAMEAEGDERTEEEIEADRTLMAKVDQESDAFQDSFHDGEEEAA